MWHIATRQFDRVLGIEDDSDSDRAVLRERFIALKRQIPWLHGMLLASLAAFVVALRVQPAARLAPAILLLGIIVGRAILLPRVNAAEVCHGTIKSELRKTYLTAATYFLVAAWWHLTLYLELPAEDASSIAVFSGLAALGASAALSSLPAAARIPILVCAAPAGLLLLAHHKPAHQAVGLALVVVVVVRLRLIRVQNRTFEHLVHSRFEVGKEQQRAVKAEGEAIAERRRVEVIANTDPLTGLLNRRGFFSRVETLTECDRRKLGLILIDLDGFKPINDTFGHLTGDALLREVSRRLRGVPAEQLLVARLGGDEFAIICKCGTAAEAVEVAQEAVSRVSAPYRLYRRDMRISACAGVSYQGEEKVLDGVRRADIALYDAKQGCGRVSLFTEAMEHSVHRRTSIEQALREPTLISDIDIAFQPIFELQAMQLRSFEALARWQHPRFGWVSPSEFIPITEQINVVQELTRALLSRAAAAARNWPETIRLSFNLSPVQLCSPIAFEDVLSVLSEAEFHPSRLQIEVTETALLADFETARANLCRLREAGVAIVLDDFGAGYSSISYLREMQFDSVKLDGSMIASLPHPGSGIPLLKGILALCRAMNQDCVVEHIETQGQLEMLRKLGFRYGQGFGLCPPVTEDEAPHIAWSGGVAQNSQRVANG
jgi:diguanylate cyclase (GGDEF)-like protein